MADVAIEAPEQIQVAIVLPLALTKKLDEFVRLGVGENREALIWLALDQFIVTTEQRLERKRRAMTIRPAAEPGSPEWEANFRQLEEIASRTSPLTDEQMNEVISEAVIAIRREESEFDASGVHIPSLSTAGQETGSTSCEPIVYEALQRTADKNPRR